MNDLIQFGETKKIQSADDLVFNDNGQALTNSLLVAKKFGKEHRHVLDGIRKLMNTAENSAVSKMFAESQYVNEKNVEQPMFIMNRDGFTLLAMGFTGKKAMQFKLDYINAFNNMEQTLKNKAPMSELEILVKSAQALLEQSKRIDNVERRIECIERERNENQQLLISSELSEKELPEESENSKIRSLVNTYVKATGVDYRTVWETIYDTLERRYKKRIKAYAKLKEDKSYLDVAIRNGLGEYLNIIISNMIKNTK